MSNALRLGALCEALVDCEHKTAPIDPEGHYFAVGTPAMRGNRIDYSEARPISHGTFEEWVRRLRPKSGDVLLAREAPVGLVVRIPPEENVAPGQRTVLIRPAADRLDSRYLYYWLSSPGAQYRMHGLAEGSTVPHLNVSEVRSLAIPYLPPLSDQRAIAEVLGALDDKIEANHKLAATADALARAIFASSIQQQGRYVTLDAIAVNRPGKYLSRSDYVPEGRIPVYGSNSLMGFHDRPLVEGPFGVLARIGSSCGAIRWSHTDGWVNNNASAIVPRGEFPPHILRYAMERIDMSPFRTGSGQPFIRVKDLFQSEILLPHVEVAKGIAPTLRALGLREFAGAEEAGALATLRDALLPRLMSGQLHVEEAAEMAGL